MTAFIRDYEIAFGDCDPAGIVFYPNYFRFFDISTGALFAEALGMAQSDWARLYEVVGVPMVDSTARFLAPSRPGDLVRIETRIAECRRSSFEVRHRLMRGDVLAVEAGEIRVWATRDAEAPGGIRSRPIQPEVASALGRYA